MHSNLHSQINSKHYKKEMELGFFIPKIIHIKSSISILIMMKTSNTCKKKVWIVISQLEGCGIFNNWPVCVSSDRECLLSCHGELHYRNGDPINSLLLAISSVATNSLSQVSKGLTWIGQSIDSKRVTCLNWRYLDINYCVINIVRSTNTE